MIKMNVKDPNEQTTWTQWKATKISRPFKSGDKKEINIVGKDNKHGSVGKAAEIVHDLLLHNIQASPVQSEEPI